MYSYILTYIRKIQPNSKRTWECKIKEERETSRLHKQKGDIRESVRQDSKEEVREAAKSLKIAFRFQLINFLTKHFKKLHTYMKSNASYRKTSHHWFAYFQIALKYNKSLMTDLLNIIFHEFGIRLPFYRIKFSCLYIPQGHYFISAVRL